MNSKKKFIITITSLVCVIIASIVTIVAIFAMRNAVVDQKFSVRYTATDVSATVRANVIVGDSSTPMIDDNGNDELVFLASDTEGGALFPTDDEIFLSTIDSSVVFEYIFTNDSSDIDVKVDIDTTNFTLSNMAVGYSYSYTQITNTASMPLTDSFEPMMILGEDDEGGVYNSLYVYVKATISDLSQDASFEGSVEFALTPATPVMLSFANAEDATNALLFQTRVIPANANIDSLPVPTFADGKLYTWYGSDALETAVSYPLSFSANSTVYAGIVPYLVTVSNSKTTIKNLLDDSIFVSAASGVTYTYGPSEYTKSGNEYFVLSGGQQMTISSTSNISVLKDKPSDISTKLFYSAYGAYPQTYVGSTLNETLKSATLTATGKSYTTDINGTTVVLNEYNYNGKLYAKLDGISKVANSEAKFSTGETVANNQIYFFYVEPIVAKAQCQNSNGTFTMMTLDILGSKAFKKSASDNAWKNSDLRVYLNDTFLNESGLADIVVEQSINNIDYYNSSTSTANTTDKIWIASVQEILDWSTGGAYGTYKSGVVNDSYNANRTKKASDMARATHVYYYPSYGAGYYILRTPGNVNETSFGVGRDGRITYDYATYNEHSGFCPVFAVRI